MGTLVVSQDPDERFADAQARHYSCPYARIEIRQLGVGCATIPATAIRNSGKVPVQPAAKLMPTSRDDASHS